MINPTLFDYKTSIPTILVWCRQSRCGEITLSYIVVRPHVFVFRNTESIISCLERATGIYPGQFTQQSGETTSRLLLPPYAARDSPERGYYLK